MKITNENIIKLILTSLQSFKIYQVLHTGNNRSMSAIILRLLCYKDIFKAMGKSKIMLNENDNYIYALTVLQDGNLLSASDNQTLKLWNINTYLCIKTISVDCYVESLATLPNGYVAFCSWNGKFNIWDPNNYYKLIKKLHLEGYESVGNLILLPNRCLASTGKYKNEYVIIILHHNSFDFKMNLSKHEQRVTSLVNLSSNTFASASYDGSINIWEIKKCDYICIKTLLCPKVNSLIFAKGGKNLLYSGNYRSISIWDTVKYVCIETIYHDKGFDSLLLLQNGYFAIGCYDNIAIRNMNKNQCVNKFSLTVNVKSYPSLLLLNDNRIVSYGDGKATIWNY
jgi:WD40 repeat protein